MSTVKAHRPGTAANAEPAQPDSPRLAPGTYRRVAGLARPHRKAMTVFVTLIIAEACAGVAFPLLFKRVLDDGITAGDTHAVIVFSSIICALGLLQAALQYLISGFNHRISESVILDLRMRIFDQLTRLPMAFFSRTQTGALTQRFGSDLTGAAKLYTGTLSSTISNIVGLVLTIAVMLHLSWQVTLIAVPLVPLCIVLSKRIGIRVARHTRAAMDSYARKTAYLADRATAGGAQLAALYANPDASRASYNAKAVEVRDLSLKASLAGRPLGTTMAVVGTITTALIYGVGGIFAVHGSLGAGTVVALALLLSRIYGPMTGLSQVRVEIMSSLVSFERIFEMLDLTPLVTDLPTARRLGRPAGAIEFDNVSFAYPSGQKVSLASLENMDGTELAAEIERDVLSGVSFTVQPGQTVALVGPSGGGKSTLSYLLPRLYDPTTGTVRLDGVDLKELTVDTVREHIGVVSQDCHLFHDTLRNNLLLARADATEEQIVAALHAAQISHLLDTLPGGLDTMVGERGFRLSGGEKQRLAIARLLLKDPAVVILDEATAALDAGTEAAIQQTLQSALSGRTCLVIAHRLSTIRNADLIVVMSAGGVAEIGTHDELLSNGGIYATLYNTQYGRQEEPDARPQLVEQR